MTEDLKIRVSLDTSSVKRDVQDLKKTLSDTTSGFGGIDKATGNVNKSVSQVTAGMQVMGAESLAQTAIVAKSMTKLQKALSGPKSAISNLKDELRGAFDFKNFDVDKDGIKGYFESIKIQLKEAGISAKQLAKSLSPLLAAAFKKVSMVAAGVVGAITGLIMGFNHLAESTREYRQAINQVSTSFQAIGSDVKTATATYAAFYRVLGDVGRSTEATNLLAQITTTEKDLVTWTRIATGAMAMFPDSLPTESLIEAANETIKTAKVTGTLADALNWPADAANKISKALEGSTEAQSLFNDAISRGLTVEDAFNEVLAQTNNATQREIILRASLNGIYAQSARLYEENNKALIAQNEAQNRLNQAMAKLGNIVQPLQTAFTNFKATLAEALAPAIKVVCDWLVTLVNWLATAAAWVGAFLAVIFPGAADKISSAFKGASSSIKGATAGTGSLNDGLEQAQGTAEKLRRSLQGFDELNVVSNMASSGGGSSAGAGGGGATGGGIDVSGLDTGDSVFKKAQEQMEGMKEKIKAFLEEFKIEIGVIASALGLLGLANLLSHLGKAIGLGDTFLQKMNLIKKLAASAITIVLQYSLVNEFMDNYIDGEGFKEYLKGLLVSAIGTGVLYAMWGAPGLVIGLGVTAVASLKAVLDNGGITNVESLTVALTGLASAIGAVSIAWSKLGLGAALAKAAGNIGAFFALLKEGNGVLATLSAAFPKLSGVVASIGGVFAKVGPAITGVLSSIGSVFGLTGGAAIAAGAAVVAAAIAGVVGVIVFLKENWEAMGNVVEGFFNKNIAPRLEAIGQSFQNIKNALAGVGRAILNALPDSVIQWLKDAWHWITELVKKIGEWFATVDWIKAIGNVFEIIGGIIVGVVGGAIAGAIDAFVGLIQGAIRVVEGIVDVVSGVVKAVVKLFSGDLQAAGEAVKQIGEGIVKVFQGLYDSTIGIVVNWVKGIIDWCVQMWDELVGHSIIPDMCNAIINCFKNMFTNVINGIKEWVNNVIQKCKDLWNDIKNWFTSNVAPKFTKEYWANKLDTIRQAAQEKITAAKTAIANVWSGIVSWFNSSVAPKFTKQYWANKLDTVRAAAQEKLTAAKNTITNIWDSTKSWFSSSVAPKFTVSYWTDKFNCIKEGGKAAMNGLLGIVEKAINWMVDKLNKFRISIPSWVPEIGGKSFGISLSRVSIPRLAEGGIATRSIFANIGERGREAVLPLDHNTQWMDLLADRIAARSGGAPTKIVLKVGERELGYAVIDAINQNTKQTGGLKLQLV